jgi:hypothetical protein
MRWGLVLAALVGALAWTGTALADDPLVDQYTEQVPTASGPKSSGHGGGGTGSTPLPSSVQTQLQQQGGKDAETLQKVATSPQYGAPLNARDEGLPEASSPGPLSAAVSTATDGSDGRLIGLFVALLVVAAMGFGAAAGRRSRRLRT